MLGRGQSLSHEHFNVHPDGLTWTEVATLEYVLRPITDSSFRQGEHPEIARSSCLSCGLHCVQGYSQ